MDKKVSFGLFIAAIFLSAVLSFLVARVIRLQSDVSQNTEVRKVVASQTKELRKAVCSYRSYLNRQAENTEVFLRDHPHGLQGIGIPNALLLQTAARQRKAAKALHLHCPRKGHKKRPPKHRGAFSGSAEPQLRGSVHWCRAIPSEHSMRSPFSGTRPRLSQAST